MEIRKYKQTMIAFNTNNEMVNATDMLKSFPNKRMNDFLRLKSTKEYLSHLETKTGIPALVVKNGGASPGTWMNKLLAYDFAAWLDIEFKLFVYQAFDSFVKIQLLQAEEKLSDQQKQLDYFWDKSDINDLYNR